MIYHTLPLNTPALVVEPDNDMASMVMVALRAAGYAPRLVKTSQEAMRFFSVFQPKLLLLDYHLADTATPELLNFLYSDTHLSSTWVMIITDEPGLALPFRNNSLLTLLKPVSFTQLRDLAIRFRRSAD